MDKLKQLESFVAVATRGSLTAAAQAEGVAPAIMGRRLDALEARLGARLFERARHGYQPTEAGALVLANRPVPLEHPVPSAGDAAQAFADGVGFTGVVLTKLDGDARGGAALSVREVTGRPIMFASTGEKLEDFETFHAVFGLDRFKTRIVESYQQHVADRSGVVDSQYFLLHYLLSFASR